MLTMNDTGHIILFFVPNVLPYNSWQFEEQKDHKFVWSFYYSGQKAFIIILSRARMKNCPSSIFLTLQIYQQT